MGETDDAGRHGINPGMKSVCPSPEQVLDALGEKAVDGFGRAVVKARQDLAEFRAWRPGWVADSSSRGLLNLIHDRLWAHLTRELDDLPHVAFVDHPPKREMYVHGRFRFRVKRHTASGLVRTYPTQAALDFMAQPTQLPLDGLEEVHLCAGYVWDDELREIGESVLSLRDGMDLDRLLWMHRLDPPAADGFGGVAVPLLSPDTPRRPVVGLRQEEKRKDAEDS